MSNTLFADQPRLLQGQMIRILERDRDRARGYQSLCDRYIREARRDNDPETAEFWERIRKQQVEEIAYINSQLRSMGHYK